MIDWLRRIWRAIRQPGSHGGETRSAAATSSWHESTVTTRDASMPRADPYHDWARTTGFAYYGPTVTWLPLLIELREECGTAEGFASLASTTAEPWADNLRVPDVFSHLPAPLKPLTFMFVLAKREFLSDIDTNKTLNKWIKRTELGRAMPTANLESPTKGAFVTGLATPVANYAGTPKVVTGVIDDGIAFAHDRLWSLNGTTRIEFLWDQQEPLPALGTQYTKSAIDTLMANSRHGSLIDEDEVYRRSGHIDQTKAGHKPLAARASHGAHVMDLASRAAAPPVAGEQPIIAVQLPVVTVEDTSGATLGPQVFFGVLYVVLKAMAIASAKGVGPLPVVANVSYGTIAGPHDGKSTFEAMLDHLIALCSPHLGVVIPAGNNRLSRCHAEFSLAPRKSKTLDWRVLPDDRTESHLEIWLPDGGRDAPITITVTAPDGTTSNSTSPGTRQLYIVGNSIVAQASFYPPGYVGSRAVLRLSIAPTGSPDAGVALSPAGLWRVEVMNESEKQAVNGIHAWIQRDDTAPGYKRLGRQSRFDDPSYQRSEPRGRRFESDDPSVGPSYVTRPSTLNAMATGDRPIVIGGFRRIDWVAWADSGGGPALPPGRANGLPGAGPDAMYPSEDTPSHHGLLGAGTRSGSCVAMNGTSVAAPLATRRMLNRVLAGSPPASVIGRTPVFNDAKLFPNPPPVPPPDIRGGGRAPEPVQRKARFEP